MAITLKQITGKIVIPGTTMGIRVTVTATPMTNAQALTFPNDDTLAWGPVVATTDANGVLPASFKIPTNSEQQAQLLWKFTAVPLDKHSDVPKSWLMGDYEITGTGTIDLADLVDVDVTAFNPATFVTLQSLVDAAAASATSSAASATSSAASASVAHTLVTADLGTTDGQTWALITDPNSLTAGGLADTLGIKDIDTTRALPALTYVKQQLSHDDPTGMVIWTQKVAGDSTDVNVDGSVIVKHGKEYDQTDGYADTLQVYTLAGSAGTIVGNNDYSGYESTLPYAPGFSEVGAGFVRFELGPRWPISEVGRFNNGGDFMLGGFSADGIVGELYDQSGTTVTQTTGADNFSAADVGKYLQWQGPGCDGTMDRITAYLTPTSVTVESSRVRVGLAARKVVPGMVIRNDQSIETHSGLTLVGDVDVEAILPVHFGSQFVIGADTVDADAAADVFIKTQANADKGLVIRNGSAGQTANPLEVQDSTGALTFAVDANGVPTWWTSNAQTTVGAAGAAAALPATPTKYLKVKDSSGATFVVAAYAAS